jgi:integrase
MGRLVIPGVVKKRNSFYRRFKVKGADGRWRDEYVPLPPPDDPRFAEALAKANSRKASRTEARPDSMAALCGEFRAALARKSIAEATRRNQILYIGRIEAEHGHRLVRDLRPQDCYRLRDSMAGTPGTANNFLSVLRLLMAFACERGWRDTNPAAGVKPLNLGEHEPWPADVIEAALAAADPVLRLAIVSGLCGGQRIGDLVRLRHDWHDGALLQFSQQKTGKFVAVPMHPLWLAEIAAVERKAVTLLYDRLGRPFASTEPLQARLRRSMRALGYEGFTFHGLRKNACCYLLELGLSDTEVGAILGMTPEMVRHYGKRAQVLMIARGAAERVTSGKIMAFRR